MAIINDIPVPYTQIGSTDGYFTWLRSVLNQYYPLNRITKDFKYGEPGIRPGMAVSVGGSGKIYKTDISDGDSIAKYVGVVESWQNSDGVFRVVVMGHCTVPDMGWVADTIYNIDVDSYLTTSSPTDTIQVAIGIGNNELIITGGSSSGGGGSTNGYFPQGW